MNTMLKKYSKHIEREKVKTMNRKERVINSLNHKNSDIMPYYMDLTIDEYEKMLKYCGNDDFYTKSGLHMTGACYTGNIKPVTERNEFFIDDFNVVWNRTGVDKDIGVIDTPNIPDFDIADYKVPTLDKKLFRSQIENAIAKSEDKFVFSGIGFTLFERAWSICSMENVLMAMAVEKEFLHELLEKIYEYNSTVLDIVLEFDVDCVHFGDDWGQQKGLIMGPDYWREFIKPYMKKLYAKAKSAGKFVSQHSCGDIIEIFPDLIDMGLDCYQTFQPEIYDIEAVKREYGNDLTFWGGISTQRLLPYATPEKVKSETVRIMNIMGKNGGYIAAPTHSVPCDVPPENLVAMLDVFMNQGKYL